jgi:sarcosine oxidase subunit alpha
LTTPDELGFGWAVSKKKPFFVGKRSIEMRARLGQTRRLVGLCFPADARELPDEGSLVLRNGAPVGHVTSIGYSPTLGHPIALAYAHAEDSAEGTLISIRCGNGRIVETPVVAHAFFDPQNKRQDL